MLREVFHYRGSSLGVSVPAAQDIGWLQEFLCPWFDCGVANADSELVVEVDGAAYRRMAQRAETGVDVSAFQMDERVIRFPQLESGNGELLFHEKERAIIYSLKGGHVRIISQKEAPAYRVSMMRIIREFAMGAAQQSGDRFIHAAGFAVHNRAMLISGPRESGKTTLLTYMLSRKGTDYLCNDRLLIPRSSTDIVVQGMPTIVSVREGTLQLLPAFAKALKQSKFTVAERTADCGIAGSKQPTLTQKQRNGLSAAQYCNLTCSDAVKQAVPAAILFPVRTGRPGGLTLKQLDRKTAELRLSDSLFGNISPRQLSQAFTPQPENHAKGVVTDDAALREHLASSIPAYTCDLGEDTFIDGRAAEHLLCIVHKGTDNLTG